MIRKDRTCRKGGGLLVYVNDQFGFKVWSDLHHQGIETLWFTIRTPRMPRDFSHLSVGVVYHPPDSNNELMLEHINSAIDHIRSHHPQSGFIITGDFNKLPAHRFASNGQLKQLVKQPTRNTAILDKLFTNMSSVYVEAHQTTG